MNMYASVQMCKCVYVSLGGLLGRLWLGDAVPGVNGWLGGVMDKSLIALEMVLLAERAKVCTNV